MKLYKYTTSATASGYIEHAEHYGYLEYRKVDEINPPIQVFVHVAMRVTDGLHISMVGIMEKVSGSDIDLYAIKENKWKYISSLSNFEECSKKDYKRVEAALKARVESLTEDFSLYNDLKNRIEKR